MTDSNSLRKRFLLLVLDGIRPDIMRAAIREGDAPNFRELSERGEVRYDAVSVFPSITPAATSAIATGEAPGGSGILGHAWFDRKANETVVYGAKTSTVLRTGAVQVFHNHVWRMNRDHLLPPTIFEELHERGIDGASVHFPVRRGPHEHLVRSRIVESYIKGSRYLGQSVAGPKELFLGDLFYSTDFGFNGRKGSGGLHRSAGINDDYAVEVGVKLISQRTAPFTLLYFFRGDQMAHHEGLAAQRKYLAKLDGFFGRIAAAAGGIDVFLEDYAVLAVSDHGHAPLLAKRRYVSLSRLKGRSVSFGAKASFGGGTDTVVVPNGRAASYYLRDPSDSRAVAQSLAGHRGIDFAAWREDGWVFVRKRGREMRFRKSEAGLSDGYGGAWEIEGEAGILGVETSGDHIEYGDYPDALNRLWECGISGRAGDVIASATQGHTFGEVSGGYHEASDHGALFHEDSLVFSIGVGVPAPRRITDVTPTILAYFDTDTANEADDVDERKV
ncbi:MAG: alkaline phosphatase family protein [Rubrobacter sp.]